MKKSDQTKHNILVAGTRLFNQNGYSNTTTKEIALMAEVSEATLFKYYISKDGLFKAILNSLVIELKKSSVSTIATIIAAKYKDRPLYHTLSNIITNRIEFLNLHDSTLKVIIQEALINPELKEQIQTHVWPEVSSTLYKLFQKSIDKGEIRPQNVAYLTSSFISIISSPIFASYLVPNYDNAIRKTYILEQFELFYSGISMKGDN